MFSEPPGNAVVVIVSAGAIAMERPTDASPPALSAACMMKLEVPTAEGVPEIRPVDEFRVRPAGSDPFRKK